MIRRALKLIFPLLALWGAACTHRGVDLSAYDRTVYRPTYASGFEIVGAEGMQSTILKVFNPWQGAQDTETMLFIARNGEKAPEGFAGQVVQAGAQRIVCMSSTHVAELDALGESARIVGGSGVNYLCNEYIATHRDRVADIGYEGNLNYEQLVALEPDLVLIYGVTSASGMEPKLQELGIPYTYIGDYLEESPLGKAEWMVAIAEILDRREEGERIYAGIPERYNALKALASQVPGRPSVMLNMPYGDNWFMPSTGSYQVRLLRDAGAELAGAEDTGNSSRSIDLEEAYRLASEAEFWLNTNQVNTRSEFLQQLPKFAEVSSVKQNRIYNNTLRQNAAGGNDYWESGVMQPDVVLHDLIVIFHPELLEANDRELHFYRQLN